MGCDIHAYVERRPQYEEEWIVQSPPSDWDADDFGNEWYIGRDYSLFGRMAGVRSQDETPIVPPRGLPIDVSPEVAATARRWGFDGHSHSVLSIDELRGAGILVDLVSECERLPGECRVVFWFDN